MADESASVRRGWDVEADVVVAGYGFAGAAAAIAAHDAGSRVLLLEKAPHFGGNSIVSGGGAVLALDAEKAAQYLLQLAGGNTPEDVVRRLARGLVELRPYLEEMARAVGARIEFGKPGKAATYPLPGGETLYGAKAASTGPFDGYPWVNGLRGGARLFKIFADNVGRRSIETWYSTAARKLVTDSSGVVLGLVAEREGQDVRIKARRGVVLATGGFENNEFLRRQFLQAQPVYPVCTLTNTGDGILMAQKVGAALWHMWHFHGSYGFKFPEFPFAFRVSVKNRVYGEVPMPWIVVDKRGRRYMNEYPPAIQDTSARGLEQFDPEQFDHPRIPSYVVFDEKGRLMGPIAMPTINDERYSYDWSEDNSAEIERGWIDRADSIEELAERIALEPGSLSRTVDRWNEQCSRRVDDDYGRTPVSMCPISTAPFYAVPVWPVVSNTQGGPVHDSEQRILDAFGKAIPRLYAAGELGSLYGYVYQLSGNLSECFVGGRIAGQNVAGEEPWDVDDGGL